MKIFTFALLYAVPVLILTGCAGKNAEPEKTPQIQLAGFTSADEKIAHDVAKIFAAAFEKSLISGDFKHLESQLPPLPSVKKFTAAEFAGMRDSMIKLYGTPRKLSYAASLQQGKLRDMLWKVTFEWKRTPEVPAETREILLCIRIFKANGKSPEIAGFFFKRF